MTPCIMCYLRDSLDALVTYDGRMIEVGRMAGLRVASPGGRSE